MQRLSLLIISADHVAFPTARNACPSRLPSQMVDKLSSLAIEFLVLAWFFVTLRCGVRLFIVKSFGIDDWLMLLSVVSLSQKDLRRNPKDPHR